MSREIWAFLFFLGLIMFNWPFLHIFGDSLPSYMFGQWGLFILAIVLIIGLRKDRDSE